MPLTRILPMEEAKAGIVVDFPNLFRGVYSSSCVLVSLSAPSGEGMRITG